MLSIVRVEILVSLITFAIASTVETTTDEEIPDFNECDNSNHTCHKYGTCINNHGRFSCKCKNGWTGDGFYCEDIDECVSGEAGCHKNATCTNLEGSHECTCDSGFEGDGKGKDGCEVIRYREDLRCGPRYLDAGGSPAQCNPLGEFPCCSDFDWCGITEKHCDCVICQNWRPLDTPLHLNNGSTNGTATALSSRLIMISSLSAWGVLLTVFVLAVVMLRRKEITNRKLLKRIRNGQKKKKMSKSKEQVANDISEDIQLEIAEDKTEVPLLKVVPEEPLEENV